MKSHGVEWSCAVFVLVSVLYVTGFFKIEKSNSELQLSISDTLVYSILGRLFDRVVIREVAIFFEMLYVLSVIGFFCISIVFIEYFELALIVSILCPAILNFTFIKLGFFKFYEAGGFIVSK